MRVAFLTIPGVQMLDVAGPMDVFSEANNQARDPDAYALQIVGLTLEPVTAKNGTRFIPDLSVSHSLQGFDTLLVAGSPCIRDYEQHAGLIEWLARESRHVRRLASVCTGAFLLARAGLLNGREATTHWNSTARLAQSYSGVKVDPNRIYITQGSATVTAL